MYKLNFHPVFFRFAHTDTVKGQDLIVFPGKEEKGTILPPGEWKQGL